MTSLTKLTKYINLFKNRNFKKQIVEEKKKKYLFRDDFEKANIRKRNSFLMWKKKTIEPYTNFFSRGVDYIDTHVIESRALSYIGGVLLTLSGYIIFFSPYFQVSPSNVLIESMNQGVDLNIAYRSIEDIYGTSLFFLDEEETAVNLKKSLKNISHIRIEKLYPNGLKVLITGSPIPYKTTIVGLEKKWGLSENGVLIPNISTGSGGEKYQNFEITSENLKNEVFLDYKQVIDDKTMLSIHKIIELFQTEFPNLTIAKIRYFSQEDELHLKFEKGGTLIFSIGNNGQGDASGSESLEANFITLIQYLKDHEGELTTGTIRYIDTRIPKKLFVCRDIVVCNNNLISVYGSTYSIE